MVEPLVTPAYPDFAELVYRTQRSVLEAAVEADQTHVVMTFPYSSNLERDVDFIAGLTATSRKAYGKITTTELMNTMIEKYDFDEPAPVEGNVTIDTDRISAEDAALQIKQLIRL